LPRWVIGITDRPRGFINALDLAVYAPGDGVGAVIACDARLHVIDQVARYIIAVIAGVGLVGNVAAVITARYRIRDVLQPVVDQPAVRAVVVVSQAVDRLRCRCSAISSVGQDVAITVISGILLVVQRDAASVPVVSGYPYMLPCLSSACSAGRNGRYSLLLCLADLSPAWYC
jgi:hypothetical protein